MNLSDLKSRCYNLGVKYENLGKILNRLLFIITFGLFLFAVKDIGFSLKNPEGLRIVNPYYGELFFLTGILYLIRSLFFTDHILNRKVFFSNSVLGIFLIFSFFIGSLVQYGIFLDRFFSGFYGYQILAIVLFFLEGSRLRLEQATRLLNPAQLFMISFAIIIFFGALLLMMPQSTTTPIRFIDALFTSTSAVCVTGLVVVDTATRFTFLGKMIILALIQIGGIGVMTITSFFGFFFKETSSFREQALLREYMSEESFTGILKTLIKVVLITILIEAFGVLFIYLSLQSQGLGSVGANIRFAVFHSISAFCNAGFSTLTDNLYDVRIRENWALQLSVANLIVVGGLGYPVLLNIYKYFKIKAIWIWEYFKYRKPYVHHVGMITFNSKLVISSTLILLILGTLSFLWLESDYTQKGVNFGGRLVMSFFQSVTPRTAGFNNCNMEALARPSVLVIIFLMWVGASPVSTGGGIKTSTFTIAMLNIIRILHGKNHIEIHKHEIHEYSVNKSFAIIILSLLMIGTASFIIYLIDGQYGLLSIVFNCFSAFGTVGLSINVTSPFSGASKLILIALMYMGRMGCLTLLLSFTSSLARHTLYRYPKENLIIT